MQIEQRFLSIQQVIRGEKRWMTFCPIDTGSVGRRSFVPHTVTLVSRKWFDLESPNFTRSFILTCFTSTPDMSHDVTIYFQSEIIAKQRRKWHLLRVWVEFLENCTCARTTKFYLLIGHNSPTNLPDLTSLAASGWLQNAIKYCIKVRKMVQSGHESHCLT